jgi:hypothetical protein
MKKILGLIALMVVLSLALAACSSKGTYVEQPVAPTVAVEETYGPPAPVVTAEPTEIPGPEGSLG